LRERIKGNNDLFCLLCNASVCTGHNSLHRRASGARRPPKRREASVVESEYSLESFLRRAMEYVYSAAYLRWWLNLIGSSKKRWKFAIFMLF
jgi:hypothetical protein